MTALISGILVVVGAYGALTGIVLTGFALLWCLWTLLFGVRGAESYMDD